MATVTVVGASPFQAWQDKPDAAQDALLNLTQITQQYSSWNDSLSQELFDCLDKAFTHIAQKEELPLGAIVEEIVLPLIQELSQILSRLPKPCIDGDWVSDESVREEYMKKYSFSPLDGSPLTPEAKPHEFALALLDWIGKLPIKLPKMELALVPVDTRARATQLELFHTKAELVLERNQNGWLGEQLDEGTAKLNELGDQLVAYQAKSAQDVAEGKLVAQQMTADNMLALTQQLATITTHADARADFLEGRVAASEQSCAALKESNNELHRKLAVEEGRVKICWQTTEKIVTKIEVVQQIIVKKKSWWKF